MAEELSHEIDMLVPWGIFHWVKVSKYHTQSRVSSFESHRTDPLLSQLGLLSEQRMKPCNHTEPKAHPLEASEL